MFALVMLITPVAAFAQVSVGVAITVAPPELPVYEQPVCPGEGYIWTPGYWAWADGDYYWVPGTWVLAPQVGFLWTPGYWGWGGSSYIFHAGYWGPQVGFYGGINYGFGYFGRGYEGGRWEHDHFYYNRAINNVNVTVVHNVYETKVVNNYNTVRRVSYNGGNGGINERPTRQEEAAARERHLPPVAVQEQHVEAARADRQLRASENHGRPPIAATPRPAEFNGHEAAQAREVHNEPPSRTENNPTGRTETNTARATPVHPRELPPYEKPAPPNTGNPKVDKKYQQQQDKMAAKQDQDRQKLQQKQEKEHQNLVKKNADDARKQQVEQKHQQQTQHIQQKQVQQQQHLQQKQQQPQQHAAAPQHQNGAPPNHK